MMNYQKKSDCSGQISIHFKTSPSYLSILHVYYTAVMRYRVVFRYMVYLNITLTWTDNEKAHLLHSRCAKIMEECSSSMANFPNLSGFPL